VIGFVLVAAVVICTPGPDTGLTIRNTLLGGRANGFRTPRESRSARRSGRSRRAPGRGRRHEARPRGSAAGFRLGILSNLANPKMVFFTSRLPQFGTGFGGLLALGLVFARMTLVWLSAYALAVARAKHLLVRGGVALDAVAAAALVGLGARLAVER
jgi:threonine/homoserine/homoserine lactone efflux protein